MGCLYGLLPQRLLCRRVNQLIERPLGIDEQAPFLPAIATADEMAYPTGASAPLPQPTPNSSPSNFAMEGLHTAGKARGANHLSGSLAA